MIILYVILFIIVWTAISVMKFISQFNQPNRKPAWYDFVLDIPVMVILYLYGSPWK